MNEELVRAQDAQLDWALGEAVGESTPPDLLATVRRQLAAPPPTPNVRRSARSWLTAACVLLGLGVVVAVWRERPQAGPAVPLLQPAAQPQEQQEPEPAWVTASNTEELAQVPDDCAALRLYSADVKMVAALARLKRLTHLDLGLGAAPSEQSPLDQAMLREVARLVTLRVLRLDYRVELDPVWLQELAGLPLLETLGLKFVPVDDAAALRLSTLPSLRKLDLAFSCIGDEGLAALVSIPGLRELSLRACGKLTAEGLKVLGQAARLEVLDLSCIVGLASGLRRAVALRPMAPAMMQRSESMMLAEMAMVSRNAARSGKGVNDEVLLALKPLTRLRELRLFGCGSVTADGIAAVPAERLRTLELTVQGGFAPFAAVLPAGLEFLCLSWSPTIVDADLQAVARKLPGLQRVGLVHCTGIGDAGVESLLQGCPITELNLDTCTGLTDKSLPLLLAAPKLRKLSVSGLRWIDDNAKLQLQAMPGMQLEIRAPLPGGPR